ncbi:MAG: hypothetical protein QHH80_11905 [Anaerolineae bacterium]|nr:hypothetical protein [Anaerolineae bacterium]
MFNHGLTIRDSRSRVPRVLFVTGDVADRRTVGFLEETGQPRLVKPFGADELRRMVARMLR